MNSHTPFAMMSDAARNATIAEAVVDPARTVGEEAGGALAALRDHEVVDRPQVQVPLGHEQAEDDDRADRAASAARFQNVAASVLRHARIGQTARMSA